jgi:hypothetical protein
MGKLYGNPFDYNFNNQHFGGYGYGQGLSAGQLGSPVQAAPTPAPEYQYAIRAQYGSFIKLDPSRTFWFGRDINDASLFPTATLAEAAVKYRNNQMLEIGFSRREPFVIVPVKVTTTKTPVTTYKTTVTRELA